MDKKAPPKKKIRIECEGVGTLALSMMNPLQGDLKTLSKENYEKLKHLILTEGFSFPFNLWENPDDAQFYILDGHQRKFTLEKMRDEEGYSVPELPFNWVKAPTLEGAKRKLLAAASQFGTVNKAGVLEFLSDMSITAEDILASFNMPEVSLPDIVVEKFSLNEVDENDITFVVDAPPPPPQAISPRTEKVEGPGPTTPPPAMEPIQAPPPMPTENVSMVRMVQLFFNKDTQAEFLQKAQKLQEMYETANLTDTVLEVIREAFDSIGKK